MIDTAKLRKAVKHFEFYSRPSNADRSIPCTVGDLRDVIDGIAKLMKTFIDEIEDSQSE